MDRKLYNKRITSGGRTIYDESIYSWWHEPQDGVWWIYKDTHSISYRYLAKKIKDIKNLPIRSYLEVSRDDICKCILDTFHKNAFIPNDLVNDIFEIIQNKKPLESKEKGKGKGKGKKNDYCK